MLSLNQCPNPNSMPRGTACWTFGPDCSRIGAEPIRVDQRDLPGDGKAHDSFMLPCLPSNDLRLLSPSQ